jgi:two-component system, OmpR family, response regulator
MRLPIPEGDNALGVFMYHVIDAEEHGVCVLCEDVNAIGQHRPDLTILDLNMPVTNSDQVLDVVSNVDVDLLVITAHLAAGEEVSCPEHGGNIRMVKLCSPRDAPNQPGHPCHARMTLRTVDLGLDRFRHMSSHTGRFIILTGKEYALIKYMVVNQWRFVSRTELLKTFWNLGFAQKISLVDVYA